MSLFRQIVSSNKSVAASARLEYMIGWLSPSGGVRSWFFSSSKNLKTTDYKQASVDTLDGSRSFPLSKIQEYKIVTENLDYDTFQYVKSIMESDYVFLIRKNAEPYQKKDLIKIKNGKVKEHHTKDFYDFAFTFVTADNSILNL